MHLQRPRRGAPPPGSRTASIIIAGLCHFPEPYLCPLDYHTVPLPTLSPICPTCCAPFLPPLVLARSAIHGIGVFISGSVAPDVRLVSSSGAWVSASSTPSDEEVLGHPDPDQETVWFPSQPDWIRFINHSDTPNCVVHVLHIRGDDIPFLFSGPRAINAHTELTIDYGPSYPAATRSVAAVRSDAIPT
jgi:hypothetical protein